MAESWIVLKADSVEIENMSLRNEEGAARYTAKGDAKVLVRQGEASLSYELQKGDVVYVMDAVVHIPTKLAERRIRQGPFNP